MALGGDKMARTAAEFIRIRGKPGIRSGASVIAAIPVDGGAEDPRRPYRRRDLEQIGDPAALNAPSAGARGRAGARVTGQTNL